jgi:2,4-dienoyl-CoA reductase-like NADH-dependent reductase (Old Yellow Enzyme family)
MAEIFEATDLSGIQLRNRLVRSATWEGLADAEGRVTPELVRIHEVLAEGGVGLIISSYMYVQKVGKQAPGQIGVDSDEMVPGLTELAGSVHDRDAKIVGQIVHCGGQADRRQTGGLQPVAPSAVESPGYSLVPHELTIDEIHGIVEDFAAAARRLQRAGFDGVQLHGAHGYLINQFLSPLMNRREDDYGGDLAGRMRFLEEVYAAVRRQVGADYPVTIKLTAADHLEGGFEFAEALQVAQRLAELGIDAIEVSSGTAASGKEVPVRQGIDRAEDEAYNAPYARRVKAATGVPVMVVGGLRSGPVLRRLLEDGDADLFSLSRPLIRQPDLVNRWRVDGEERATCISCNGCFRPGLKGEGIYCVVDRIEAENRSIEV